MKRSVLVWAMLSGFASAQDLEVPAAESEEVKTVAASPWAIPMAVVTTQTVVTATATLKLRTIVVDIPDTGEATISVGWRWTDAAGNLTRRGTSSYSETQLTAAFAGAGVPVTLDQLRELFKAIALMEAKK